MKFKLQRGATSVHLQALCKGPQYLKFRVKSHVFLRSSQIRFAFMLPSQCSLLLFNALFTYENEERDHGQDYHGRGVDQLASVRAEVQGVEP